MDVSNYMNSLAMTLEEDKRFLCVWLFYNVSNFAASRMEVTRYRSVKSNFMKRHFFFCFSVFSSSEVLDKITSIQRILSTAACWSGEEKRGNCEANLL